MPVSVRWRLFLDLWKFLPYRSGFNQPWLIKQLFTVRIKHGTEILFKSRRIGCSFCFLYHGMSCKDSQKIVCTHKYKTLQWSHFTVESAFRCCFLLFTPSRISTWLKIQSWVFMLRRNERWFWDALEDQKHQPAPRVVLWYRLLSLAVSLKQPLRPWTALLNSTHPPV